MASKRAGRPGVPASTSKNGASAPRTCWLAFRSAQPVLRSSVWASSSSTTSGRRRQREVSAAARSHVPLGGVHSAAPMVATPILRGSSLASHRRGASASKSADGSGSALGVSHATSTPGWFCAQALSNQRRSAVFPLPRGPSRTTSCGGASPLLTPARQRQSTACSSSRPVRAGGAAPLPALKTHVVAVSIGSAVYAAVDAGLSANRVGNALPSPLPPQPQQRLAHHLQRERLLRAAKRVRVSALGSVACRALPANPLHPPGVPSSP